MSCLTMLYAARARFGKEHKADTLSVPLGGERARPRPDDEAEAAPWEPRLRESGLRRHLRFRANMSAKG